MQRILTMSVIVLVLAFVCPLAYAEDTSDTKAWDFQLAPFYLWAVNMDGDVTVKTTTTPLKMDFGEIFDNLEGLFTAHFEAWHKKKWGLLVDVSYINIGGQQVTPIATLDVDFQTVMTELGGFYRFRKGPHALEGLAGIRYTSLDVEVDMLGLPPKLEESQDWLDPIIGARYRWTMAEKWSLSVRGDIGGFGIGDASDFTWNLAALIHYQPWKHVALVGGYRVLDVDYETGSGPSKFAYDVQMQGPILGVSIVW